MPNRAHEKGPRAGRAYARPGDYDLGSPASRAAARAVLACRLAKRKRIDLIVISDIPRPSGDGIRVGAWRERKDGTLSRISLLPPGINLDGEFRLAE